MEAKYKAAYEAQKTFMPKLAWEWKPLGAKKTGTVVLARLGGKKVVAHGIKHLKSRDETLCGQSVVEAGVMAIHYKLNWIVVEDDANCSLCLKAKDKPKGKAKKQKGPKLTTEQEMILADMQGDDDDDDVDADLQATG